MHICNNVRMDDLNDLFYFSAVVQYNGFSAASRVIGVEKTKLSRRVAALEKQLGVRLLQRSTRTLSLTEAGERFYAHCQIAVEAVRGAYEVIGDLQKGPSGTVRISCPVVLAQSYLAPILPSYMLLHPKVTVVVEATDRAVNLFDERIDLAIRTTAEVPSAGGLVAKEIGITRRILVASPDYLNNRSQPKSPQELSLHEAITSSTFLHDGRTRWRLVDHANKELLLPLTSRLVSSDLRVQLEAAVSGSVLRCCPSLSFRPRSNQVCSHIFSRTGLPRITLSISSIRRLEGCCRPCEA